MLSSSRSGTLYVARQAVVNIHIDSVSKIVYSAVAPHRALCAVCLCSSEHYVGILRQVIFKLILARRQEHL